MKKQIIQVLMLLLLIQVASALDLCTDTISINSNCTMVSPYLDCQNFTYQIINLSGDIVSNGDLSLLSAGIYSFNFTEAEGSYIVIYCDNTTRQVRKVQEDDSYMIIAALILVPLILGIFFLIGAATLNEKHAPIRIFLFLLSIITFFSSFHMGMAAVVKFYDFPEMQDIIGTTTYWVSWVFYILISYFLIYLFYTIVHHISQKRRENLEY